MVRKPKIILLAGPTASGKSKLAINLSKKLNGEIVNADSMKVYKELKILTSRPNHQNKKKIKCLNYHLIKDAPQLKPPPMAKNKITSPFEIFKLLV